MLIIFVFMLQTGICALLPTCTYAIDGSNDLDVSYNINTGYCIELKYRSVTEAPFICIYFVLYESVAFFAFGSLLYLLF